MTLITTDKGHVRVKLTRLFGAGRGMTFFLFPADRCFELTSFLYAFCRLQHFNNYSATVTAYSPQQLQKISIPTFGRIQLEDQLLVPTELR